MGRDSDAADTLQQQAPGPGMANPGDAMREPLVTVEGLTKLFPVGRNLFRKPSSFIHAADDVTFQLERGESLGMVGESGYGKTTVGKLLELTGGRIRFRFAAPSADGESDGAVDPSTLKGRQLRHFRRQAQMIFQDPYESMNPRRTIYDIISEPLSVQGIGDVLDRVDRVAGILTLVGLTPATAFLFRHPHELSGGQRQRVAIARALVIRPSFVVADEPTSMLDVSSRTGVMSLMQELARELGVAYLYVTHDLAVALYVPPDRRDVPGEGGGAGRNRGIAAQPAASLHQGAVVSGARPRSAAPPTTARHPGRSGVAGRPAIAVPVLRPVSRRHRPLSEPPAPSHRGKGPRPPGGLLRGISGSVSRVAASHPAPEHSALLRCRYADLNDAGLIAPATATYWNSASSASLGWAPCTTTVLFPSSRSAKGAA